MVRGVFPSLETDLAPAIATFAGLLGMVLTFRIEILSRDHARRTRGTPRG